MQRSAYILVLASLGASCSSSEQAPRAQQQAPQVTPPNRLSSAEKATEAVTSPLTVSPDFQGIKVATPELEVQDNKRVLVLHGIFGVHVKGGSQLAIWSGFPGDIQVFATELATGARLESFDLSVSEQPDEETVQMYARMPQDRVVQEEFEIVLLNKLSALEGKTGTFELSVSYWGMTSNVVRITLP